MKIRYIFLTPIFLAVFSLQLSIAQPKSLVLCHYQSKSIQSRSFERSVQKLSASLSDYSISTQSNLALIHITPSVKTSGLKTIEGMEVQKTGKGSLQFKIRDEVTGKDTLIKFDYQIKGGLDQQSIENSLLEKFENDSEIAKSFYPVLNKMFNEHKNCNTTLISQYIFEEKDKDALTLSLKYKKNNPACANNLDGYIKEITYRLDSVHCAQTLYEAEILINSGIEFKINKAVNMLLQISPSASCAKESLALSEKIYTHKALKSENKQKLEVYKTIVVEKKYNDWYDINY